MKPWKYIAYHILTNNLLVNFPRDFKKNPKFYIYTIG